MRLKQIITGFVFEIPCEDRDKEEYEKICNKALEAARSSTPNYLDHYMENVSVEIVQYTEKFDLVVIETHTTIPDTLQA